MRKVLYTNAQPKIPPHEVSPVTIYPAGGHPKVVATFPAVPVVAVVPVVAILVVAATLALLAVLVSPALAAAIVAVLL